MRRLTEPETTQRLHDYRLDQPRGPGFGFRDRARNTFYDWHTHDYHQLIYAVAGTTQIENRAGTLPSADGTRRLDSGCYAPPDPDRRH